MGNPIITRLGINQFWYKNWYSDKLFSTNLHQDKSFEFLLKLYLDYGLTFSSNSFIHEYWYRPSYKKFRTLNHTQNMNSYRRFFYTNDSLEIDHSYLLRNKTGEYFPMRNWFFRYLNWIVLTVQWFKPVKKKISKNNLLRSLNGSVDSVHEISKLRNLNSNILRLKFLIYLFFKKYNISKKEYLF